MSNMYELYIKEREGLNTIKTDKGFIVYKIDFPVCLISDYYVLPEYRQSGHGYFLADQVFDICKQAGVETVVCQTDDRAKGVDLSKYTIERYGFEIIKKEGPISYYRMEVSEWERY